MRKLIQNRGAGDSGKYALGAHPEGGMTVKELNTLFVLGKILSVGSGAGFLSIQEFSTVIPAGSVADVTFADAYEDCSILGGIMSVEGVDATYGFDLGHSGSTTALINDFNSGAVEDKELPVAAAHIETEDIILTINDNSNTVPVTVYIALLTVELVTSA